MRFLLDTHAFLWFVFDNPALGANARDVIADSDNEILISVASMWEVAIKVSIGKMALTSDVGTFFRSEVANNDFALLPIDLHHVAPIETLPFHHRDPFDRLLIAQSLTEGVPLVSADAAFDAYTGLTRIW